MSSDDNVKLCLREACVKAGRSAVSQKYRDETGAPSSLLCKSCNDRIDYVLKLVNAPESPDREGTLDDVSDADYALFNAYASGWI